MNDMNIHRTV